jgi:hypothetical protein
MKPKTKKRWFYIAGFAVIVVCFGIVFASLYISDKKEKENSLGSQLDFLESLDTTVSINQLGKAGYIGLTASEYSEHPRISEFLRNARADRKDFLKTFYLSSDDSSKPDLYVNLFFYDPQMKVIRAWTYEPWKHEVISDRRFSTDYKTTVENGATRIELIGVKNEFTPSPRNSKNEILYFYENTNRSTN